MTDVLKVIQDIVDEDAIGQHWRLDSQTLGTVSNEGKHMDQRMSVVVNRYDARSMDGQHRSCEPGSENDMALLTERLRRWPKDTDPGLWRVRVLVSLHCLPSFSTIESEILKDGLEEESYWAVQNRLLACPELASSLILPPSGRMWIGIESPSRAKVEKLCFNLSTVCQPLEVSLVPVEERVAWLDWHPIRSRLMSPSWARLEKRSKLANMDIDSNVIKYSGDLAFVLDAEIETKILICVVPRLPVATEGDASWSMNGDERKKQRKKCLPQLLHPKAVGEPKEAAEIAPRLDPNVWWQPGRRQELETVGHGRYRFSKKRRDEYIPPFAVCSVPVDALDSLDVEPNLTELNMFVEGMATESNGLDFPAPSREFIRWSYEHYVAAPIEIGSKVEVDLKPGTVRGVIVDVHFEQAVVRLNDAEMIHVEVKCIRRFFEVGDAVKVVNASNYNREGWVIKVEDDNVSVLDRQLMEEV